MTRIRHTDTVPRGAPHEVVRANAALAIVVADDHPLFRAGIVRALEEDSRFTVVGEAGDGLTAERLIHEREPQLALLDLRMPGVDALQLLARLRHHRPPVATVVLTAYTDVSLVHSAMAAGAAGYIAKESDRDQILDVLADAGLGRRRVLVEQRRSDDRVPTPRLTGRERTVLTMLNHGWSADEIAMLCDMPLKAVDAHVRNARRRLGAVTTDEAIAAAEAWGLLP